MIRLAAGALALLLVLPGNPLASGLVVISQNRTVSGNATADDGFDNGTDSDSAIAPGEGAFNEARSATVLLSDAIASGGGIQDSWILPTALRAEGSHFSNAEVWGGEGWSDASGATSFMVTFELAEECGYTLDGWVEQFDNGSSWVKLDDANGYVHEFIPPDNDTMYFSESGTLAAGTYTLTARSTGSSSAFPGWFDYSSGAFDLDFILDGATDAPLIAGVAPTAYPNPFRASTRLTVPDGTTVLRVFDTAGRIVRTLEGRAGVTWDGRAESGQPVPAGVYFVRAEGADADPVKLIRLR